MAHSTADDALQAGGDLNEALSKLETALLTPVVSGEMESWARSVEEAAAMLAQRLPAFFQAVLHPQYAEIAKSDPELLTRVEQLIAEDQNLLLEQDAFQRRVQDFAKKASHIKKDEAQIAADRANLEQEGLDFVLRIKRQRTAADTWLAEANYRDRGPVD